MTDSTLSPTSQALADLAVEAWEGSLAAEPLNATALATGDSWHSCDRTMRAPTTARLAASATC